MEFGQLYTGGSATVVPVYSEPTEAQSVITGPNDHTGKDQNKEYKHQSLQPLSRMTFGILIARRFPTQEMSQTFTLRFLFHRPVLSYGNKAIDAFCLRLSLGSHEL